MTVRFNNFKKPFSALRSERGGEEGREGGVLLLTLPPEREINCSAYTKLNKTHRSFLKSFFSLSISAASEQTPDNNRGGGLDSKLTRFATSRTNLNHGLKKIRNIY